MRRTAFLNSLSPIGQLVMFIAILLVFTIASSFFGMVIGMMIFDIDMSSISLIMSDPSSPGSIAFLKFYQSISQIGSFIVPSLIFAFMVSKKSMRYLLINRRPNLISVLIVIMVVFTILPFNGYLDEINQRLSFPGFLSGVEEWMKAKELQAGELTEMFVKTNTIPGLLLNIVIVGLIPAFAEEFLFRGVLLKLFNNIVKNIHMAVIISAVVFSAFHLQFYGFLPRLLMGLVLGYVFVFTSNLWVPIIMHFVNNTASVIVYYLNTNGYINIPVEDFGHSNSVVYIIGSLLISAWLIIMMYQKERSEMVLPKQ